MSDFINFEMPQKKGLATTNGVKQKRSYVSSKLGCKNCRKKFKKRCDEALPECARCVQNKVRCSYLDEDIETINRIKRAHTILAEHKQKSRDEISNLNDGADDDDNTFPQFGKFKLKSNKSSKNDAPMTMKSVKMKKIMGPKRIQKPFKPATVDTGRPSLPGQQHQILSGQQSHQSSPASAAMITPPKESSPSATSTEGSTPVSTPIINSYSTSIIAGMAKQIEHFQRQQHQMQLQQVQFQQQQLQFQHQQHLLSSSSSPPSGIHRSYDPHSKRGLRGCENVQFTTNLAKHEYSTHFEIPKRFTIYNNTAFDYSINDACFQGFMQDIWFYYMFVEAIKSLSVFAALLDFAVAYLKSSIQCVSNHEIERMGVFKKIPFHYKHIVFNAIADGLLKLDELNCTDREKFWAACDSFTEENIESIYQISTKLMYTTIILHNAALLVPNNAEQTSCFYGGYFSLMCSLQKVFLRFSKEYAKKTFSPKTKVPVTAIKSIFLPNYNIDCLGEMLGEFEKFYNDFISSTTNSDKPSRLNKFFDPKVEFQFKEMAYYIRNIVNNVKQLKDEKNVNNYPMKVLYQIIYDWLRIAPPEMILIKNNPSMNLIHTIFYTYCISFCYLLNNIFPECIYFFGSSFSTCSNIYGFDYNFYNKDFQSKLYQLVQNPDLNLTNIEFVNLRKHMNYATRVISFFNMRYNIFINNIVLDDPYPREYLENFDHSGKIRLKSRKCLNVKETQLTGFKKKFKPENFICIDLDKEMDVPKDQVVFSRLSYPNHDLLKSDNKYMHSFYKSEKSISNIIKKIENNSNYANNFFHNDGSPNNPFSFQFDLNDFDRFYNKYNSENDINISTFGLDLNNEKRGSATMNFNEITPNNLLALNKYTDVDEVDLLKPISTNGLSIEDFNPRFYKHEDPRLNLFYKNADSITFDGTEITLGVSDLYTDYYHDRNELLRFFFEN